jgi:hypothetical protein
MSQLRQNIILNNRWIMSNPVNLHYLKADVNGGIKSIEGYVSIIAIIRKLHITTKTQGRVLPGRQNLGLR